jgi:agmatinase
MKIFAIGAEKIIEHLKDYHLTEAGILPVFDVKEIKPDKIDEEIKHYCALLGGGHSITYPAFKAFAKINPGAGIIVFDAHPDEDYLARLIGEKALDRDDVILVGIRNMRKEDKRFIDEHKIKNYSMKEISFEGLREVTDNVMSVARQWPKVYLSINIDVLDPAFAPAVNTPEPGGMSTRDLLYFIQRLKMLRNLGMADLVGVNPDKDVNDITSKIAAKLLVELS